MLWLLIHVSLPTSGTLTTARRNYILEGVSMVLIMVVFIFTHHLEISFHSTWSIRIFPFIIRSIFCEFTVNWFISLVHKIVLFQGLQLKINLQIFGAARLAVMRSLWIHRTTHKKQARILNKSIRIEIDPNAIELQNITSDNGSVLAQIW